MAYESRREKSRRASQAKSVGEPVLRTRRRTNKLRLPTPDHNNPIPRVS